MRLLGGGLGKRGSGKAKGAAGVVREVAEGEFQRERIADGWGRNRNTFAVGPLIKLEE
jgi:hypothetical protein